MNTRECPVKAYTNLMKLVNSISNTTILESDINEIPTNLKINETNKSELIKCILNFPESGIEVLSDEILNKTYSLMNLSIKTNDELLIYSLISRGISVRKSKINLIESTTSIIKNLIKNALKSERKQERLEIPPHILSQLETFRSDSISSEREGRGLNLSKRKVLIEIEDNKPEVNRPISKRARLAQIQDEKEEEKKIELAAKASKVIKPEPSPKPIIPNHDPPFILKLMKIPHEATETSIKIFLEVGADAFKMANKLQHRQDALRGADKFKPGKSNNRAKFPNLSIERGDLKISSDTIDSKLYQTARVKYYSIEIAKKAVDEFHNKKYLCRTLTNETVICEFE
ncbi:hypothetical protein DFH28DRAFT_1023171 [Melampsora americana]|nr:hypothetical protein DFH28DRAFT_1023171 [Melampsora americana]